MHDRVYLLGGAASAAYGDLNDRLPAAYPRLRTGALLLGAGYGQGFGPFGASVEYRWGIRSNQDDSTRAYTSLRSHSLSLLFSYHLAVRGVYAVSVFAGPTYSVIDLTLRDKEPRRSLVGSFDATTATGGDRRRLYQNVGLLGAGFQVDRHLAWGRRNDVQACGRARQLTVGLRAQFDYRLKSGQWRTERPLFRTPRRLGVEPDINPLAFSAALVVGGLFSRY